MSNFFLIWILMLMFIDVSVNLQQFVGRPEAEH